MRCPYCGSEQLIVTDSRPHGSGTKRRRACADCGRRFSTMERPVLPGRRKIKKDGRGAP